MSLDINNTMALAIKLFSQLSKDGKLGEGKELMADYAMKCREENCEITTDHEDMILLNVEENPEAQAFVLGFVSAVEYHKAKADRMMKDIMKMMDRDDRPEDLP